MCVRECVYECVYECECVMCAYVRVCVRVHDAKVFALDRRLSFACVSERVRVCECTCVRACMHVCVRA